MDIAALAEARRQRISSIRDNISAEEITIAAEEDVLERLETLSSQSSFSIDDINFLIQVQDGFI